MIKTASFRRSLLSATFLSIAMGVGSFAHADMWADVPNAKSIISSANISINGQARVLTQSRKVSLNVEALKYTLNQAPDEHFGSSNLTIELPLPNGDMAEYTLFHSPIMAKSLSEQFPNIQTFKVVDATNPNNSGRLDLTPEGFHGMLSHNGETVFIDPMGVSGQYQSYYKSDYTAEMGNFQDPMTCGTHSKKTSDATNQSPMYTANKAEPKRKFSFGSSIRTYRLAVAATGEFSTFHGGTKESSLAAIVTGINRVNEVFESDLAVKLELVANNSDVIFTNAATDPFTDDDPDELIDEVGPELNSKIGAANYDVGHVFSTGGGGLAALGSVCGTFKAEGVTGTSRPINDPFFIEYVAHELGHQFGANHTFNSAAGACDDNREADAAYEPGSGSTIMSYANLCNSDNIANIAEAYFHTHSLTEVSTFIGNVTRGGSCGMNTGAANAVPVVDAGTDGHIPKSTPFTLFGSATDANADDILTYTWEQYDLGASTTVPADHVDDGSRPLFRSFLPSGFSNRILPQINDILNGTTSFGEVLPTMNRDLNFRLTVRDGKGGVAAENKKLTVDAAAGPFTVTAPASNVTWEAGSAQTVTWDVANTTAAPISCENVDIAFSNDGGQDFGAPILRTPNDGTQSVTIPSAETTSGRIRVMCASQPFFAINSGTVTISSSGGGTATNSDPIANPDMFTIPQGSGEVILDVLQNDTDPDGNTLTIASLTDSTAGGRISIGSENFSFEPNSDFSGDVTFNYTVSDGNGGTSEPAMVTITVTPTPPANNAPIANNDSYTVEQDSGEITLDVLGNDRDSDGDTLSISSVTNVSAGGTIAINSSNVRFTPAAGFSGTVTFNYTATDGTDTSAPADVSITVNAAATPTPTPTPTTPTSSSGGGGSFGIFMLFLIGIARKFKTLRIKSSLVRKKV